jgi:hypothetical protein
VYFRVPPGAGALLDAQNTICPYKPKALTQYMHHIYQPLLNPKLFPIYAPNVIKPFYWLSIKPLICGNYYAL